MKLIRPRGYITSPFGAFESVRKIPHTGIDFVYGFKKPLTAVIDGVVAYCQSESNPDLNVFRGLYTISDTDIGLIETCYGHVWDMVVDENEEVPAGVMIATEGNTGDMCYMGGVQVPVAKKLEGHGSHLHFSIRPIVLDAKKISGEHYRPYKYQNKFVRVAYKDNGYNGCIDPAPYFYTPTTQQWITLLSKVVGYLIGRAQKLK